MVIALALLGSASWVSLSFSEVTALLPDLVVSFKGPSSAYQGEVITDKVKITVENKGGLEARNFYVGIVLIEDSTADMCGRGFIMSLKSGKSISTSRFNPKGY